jgi:hypothetical protein
VQPILQENCRKARTRLRDTQQAKVVTVEPTVMKPVKLVAATIPGRGWVGLDVLPGAPAGVFFTFDVEALGQRGLGDVALCV